MNISRRTALGGLTLSLATPAFSQEATADDAFPALPLALGGSKEPDFVPSPTLGSVPPPPLMRQVADALMTRAPYNCAPVDVAMYFRDIGQGSFPDLGSDRLNKELGRHYVRGWNRYANPVVTGFFTATSMGRPDSDGTYWCAAFVNWCIARGRATTAAVPLPDPIRRSGSYSASSGSFRCWPYDDKKPDAALGRTETPQRGDIVVWATDRTVAGCALGPGHVAFFLGHEPGDRLLVVGGNQRDPETLEGASQSAVCRKSMPQAYAVAQRAGPKLYKRFHSFRTAPFLHG